MTLGLAERQGDLFDDVTRFCDGVLAESSVYSVLYRERDRLFPESGGRTHLDLWTEMPSELGFCHSTVLVKFRRFASSRGPNADQAMGPLSTSDRGCSIACSSTPSSSASVIWSIANL
jgi:hypothetical protein